MDTLNFYTVEPAYLTVLQQAEQRYRGFSRVPKMDYGEQRKPKFICGVVLQVNAVDYYVPVSSYKQKKPDNFLVYARNGQAVGSLRFNYMFPVPAQMVSERIISDEPDRAYKSLLAQELQFCRKNQQEIQRLAERTYRRVLLGKDKGLVINSCEFLLLERECTAYMAALEKNEAITQEAKAADRLSMPEQLSAAVQEAEKRNAQHPVKPPAQKRGHEI